MAELTEFIDTVRRLTDAKLEEIVPRSDVEPIRLHEAIRWSLFAGGKRIRPAILFAVGQTFNAAFDNISATAAAVEMIHTYSLIHDDLPAMDDDDMRRGKATCHKKFGEATAILAGDVLQTLAFKAIADDERLPADTRIKLISMIAAAAGTPSGMVAGQQLDLDAEGKTLSIAEIEQIHRGKTGAMISASALAGAIIGNASPNELFAIENYASNLGLLFQITDDLLDITQASETLGKTAGKDVTAEKATYPSHFGIEKTREMANQIHQQACDALSSISHNTELLHQLADLILNRTR
ncbi:MAG: polyprenyl synthetase family protein [Chloracidobacterium sp.]|nr:polyprenyl synthetase family protein [Chloracidobacterium sp.]